ncbi:glycerophosphoryl diester phosphodiesterase [Cellulomonas chitinilytica]|uniref:Glycerophosphoryl diester phosphodiesterase n=1 Tax=Cellulomonas chitinilytica TaxID=398759 RepID=A0A919P9X5_9CELL|nr:glycerophosphodiester phosphodiesterase [Cellulomonas chitinilytica]GIG23564.1 glycerophosphoryl diester phosphodiesterase [Cellulomonas chitinilytica]
MTHPYFGAPGGTAALAHRGFSPAGLENSMAAFQAAVDLGYRYVETDAHGTADGRAVLMHDASLDRTTDRAGRIAELPWAEVRRARVGGVEPVPVLEDVLGTWPDVRVNVDVKERSGVEPVAAAIERTAAHDRVCVASFSAARRDATVARLSRPVATSAATAEAVTFLLTGRVAARGFDAYQVPWRFRGRRVLTGRHVRAAHRAGRPVHVWTVNDPDDMRALLDVGVDGIISDRADVLRDVLVERGLWA